MTEEAPKRKKMREMLYDEDPRCHWCGRKTVLTHTDGGILPKDAATVDHLYCRLDPRRYMSDTPKVVLACFECNNERSKKQNRSYLKKLHRKPSTCEEIKSFKQDKIAEVKEKEISKTIEEYELQRWRK